MLGIKIRTRNLKTVFALRTANSQFLSALRTGVEKQAQLMASYVRKHHFSGSRPTATKLSDPDGSLRSTITVRKILTNKSGDSTRFSAGIDFSKIPYAGIHVGRKGKKTRITARSSKYLAVPLQAAKRRGWTSKNMSPLDVTQKKFLTAKNGLLVSPNNVPYYVLKKSIEVHTRIHPEEIARVMQPRISRNLQRLLQKLKKDFRGKS